MRKHTNYTMPRIMDANADAGYFYFSRDTMDYFNSQVPGETPVKARFSDDLYFFISSERQPARNGKSYPRRWHVRTFRPSSGDCSSGAGVDFTSAKNATKAAELFGDALFVLGYCYAIKGTGNERFCEEWHSVNQDYQEWLEKQEASK